MGETRKAPPRAVGESVLLIAVPEAEPVVGGVRERYDTAAAEGIPAHLTVLYPFLPAGRIDAEVLAALHELFAEYRPFALRFAEFGRFPGALWLAPQPDGPVRELTAAVAARWPEAPPYGGAFDDPVPHLTVAQGQEERTYDGIEREFADRLPFQAQVAEVRLLVFDGAWQRLAVFPLGGGSRSGSGHRTRGAGFR
ncbi:2'-5' RNA ligase family protein [Streptomyces sp. CA-111067]|uniref:2'-5' RNA ligase family protein n=1 Tax=Streptomyces sp. CA-111067 TaxID=3240046 RepID=UPI003D96FBA4